MIPIHFSFSVAQAENGYIVIIGGKIYTAPTLKAVHDMLDAAFLAKEPS